jgi:hypothetical protein
MVKVCEKPRYHHPAVFEKYCKRPNKEIALFAKGELANGFLIKDSDTTMDSDIPRSQMLSS